MKKIIAAFVAFIGAFFATLAIVNPSTSVSYGDTTSTDNTWYYTMTDPNKDGMELKGVAGSLRQIFEIKDPYGSPIFSVGHVGGANVYGDDLRVFGGNDIFNPTAVVHPDGSVEITSQATNPVVNIQGVVLTKNDIKWIHSRRGCTNGVNC